MPPANEELWNRLAEQAKGIGVELAPSQLTLLRRYVDLLRKWNSRVRLVGDATPAVVVDKHILDSLTCLKAECLHSARSVIDVGAGAGFPGVVLAIATQSYVTLLESAAKKAAFLTYVRETLRLDRASVVVGRAEELSHGRMRESFEAAVARAVAPTPVLLEYCLPFVKVGGCVVAQKSAPGDEEIEKATGASRTLGGGEPWIVQIEPRSGAGKRSLVVVRKEASTPARFPRKPGIPRKRPLGESAPSRPA